MDEDWRPWWLEDPLFKETPTFTRSANLFTGRNHHVRLGPCSHVHEEMTSQCGGCEKSLGTCGNAPCFKEAISSKYVLDAGVFARGHTHFIKCYTVEHIDVLEAVWVSLASTLQTEARAASNSFRSASGTRRHHQDTGVLFRRWSWYDKALFTHSHLQNVCVSVCVCLSTLDLVLFLGVLVPHPSLEIFSFKAVNYMSMVPKLSLARPQMWLISAATIRFLGTVTLHNLTHTHVSPCQI